MRLHTREEVATALQRAHAALRARDSLTDRKELLPLETIARVAGVLRLTKEDRLQAVRDMLVDLISGWLPAPDDYERALRQRDAQLEVAG